VGIGVADPTTLLEVSGNLVAEYPNQYLVGMRVSPSFDDKTFTGVKHISLELMDSLFIARGNVGIGSDMTPGTKLDVCGDLSLSEPNKTFVGVNIRPTFPKGAHYYGLLVADGNVGIGTATPTAKLEVNGGIKSTSLEVNHLIVSGSNQEQTGTGVVTIAANSAAVTGMGTKFQTELHIGDFMSVGAGESKTTRRVTSIDSDIALTVDSAVNLSSVLSSVPFTFTSVTPVLGTENLRILRGTIDGSNGNTKYGKGIRALYQGTGTYIVVFDSSFPIVDSPFVSVQPLNGPSISFNQNTVKNSRVTAKIYDLDYKSMLIKLVSIDNGSPIDSDFSVLVIGSRW
jgi:hypothetical protein